MDPVTPVLPTRTVFRRFWPFTRGERRWLATGAALLILAAAGDSVGLSMFSSIVDDSLATGNLDAFWRPAALWGGISVLSGLLVFGGEYLTNRSGERFLLSLRTRVFAHLHKLSPDFFERRRRGDLVARMTDDIDTVERLVSSGLVQLVTSLFSVLFFTAYAVVLSWELTLAAFVIAPLFVLVTRNFARRINDRSRDERALNGELTAILGEDLDNVAVVQAYNRQATAEHRLHEVGTRILKANLAIVRLSALYSPVVHLAETLCVLAIVALGTWEVSNGAISLGGVLAFAAIVSFTYGPLQQLGQLRVMVSAATTGSERIVELLDEEPSLRESSDARTLNRVSGHIRLKSISFAYPGAPRAAIKAFSAEVRAGEFVAITGPSGAGKSTIAKLLVRFHDPDRGSIELDGADLTTITLESLRRNVAFVQQRTALLHGTIRDNIAYGSHSADDRAVVRAAVAADAHEFITALPHGYDTVLGEHGHGLSGGQCQRIAIARAVVADAPVLVLDEPTAGLDADTVDRLLPALRRVTADRTTILITHDPRVTAIAHRVLIVAAGRVAESESASARAAQPRVVDAVSTMTESVVQASSHSAPFQ